jgi:hypothetical protein
VRIHEVDARDRALERDLAAAIEITEAVMGGGRVRSEDGGARGGETQRRQSHAPPNEINRFGY